MSYTKTMPTWEQVNALLKTKDKTPRQWAMSAAFMLNDIRNALEHSAQGEAVAKPIGKVLSESEMGVAYDRKAGSVIWFGTPSPGFIYTAPPAAAVTTLTDGDRDLLRAAAGFCKGDIGRCDPVRMDAAVNLILRIAALATPATEVTDEMVDRAMNARFPGGAEAWHWVFGGGMKPTNEHRDWFRRVVEAALAEQSPFYAAIGEAPATWMHLNPQFSGTFAKQVETAPAEPIPMVLHCPECRAQHIDTPEPDKDWTNPPHKSHLCHKCGTIWRPADVATVGVAAIMGQSRPHPCRVRRSREMKRAYRWLMNPDNNPTILGAVFFLCACCVAASFFLVAKP